MKNPSFFKPNKNNSGSLASFQFGKDSKGLALYLDIIRQDANSWNGRTGSFRQNAQKGNPNNVKVKLSVIEAAGVVKSIDSYGKIPFSAFHSSDKGSVRINFTSAPSKDQNNPAPVFFINVVRDNDKFTTMLNIQEATLLGIYIESILKQEFFYGFVAEQKKRASYNQNKLQAQQPPTQQPAQQPQAPNEPDSPSSPTQNGFDGAGDSVDFENPF